MDKSFREDRRNFIKGALTIPPAVALASLGAKADVIPQEEFQVIQSRIENLNESIYYIEKIVTMIIQNNNYDSSQGAEQRGIDSLSDLRKDLHKLQLQGKGLWSELKQKVGADFSEYLEEARGAEEEYDSPWYEIEQLDNIAKKVSDLIVTVESQIRELDRQMRTNPRANPLEKFLK